MHLRRYCHMYYVYKHTCPNSKVYIGFTGEEPEYRWNGGYGYIQNKRFIKDILRYGWDNIQHEILSLHDTKEEALAEEQRQILYHHSNLAHYGYNTLAQNRHAQCTPVAQYTTDGQHIATFESIMDASTRTGINKSTICLVCRNDGRHKRAGGYVWKYVE
jgi:hypothetical protein